MAYETFMTYEGEDITYHQRHISRRHIRIIRYHPCKRPIMQKMMKVTDERDENRVYLLS